MIRWLQNSNIGELIKDGTHIIDFYAEWCVGSKTMTTILQELESELVELHINLGKINVLLKEKNLTDLITMKRHFISDNNNSWKLSGKNLEVADINRDGKVNITDLILVKRKILE